MVRGSSCLSGMVLRQVPQPKGKGRREKAVKSQITPPHTHQPLPTLSGRLQAFLSPQNSCPNPPLPVALSLCKPHSSCCSPKPFFREHCPCGRNRKMGQGRLSRPQAPLLFFVLLGDPYQLLQGDGPSLMPPVPLDPPRSLFGELGVGTGMGSPES
jgi:hypothetical protein